MPGLNYFFPIAAVLLWAVNNVVSKMATVEFTPISISFYRWSLAAFLLTPFVIKATLERLPVIKKHLLKLIVLSSLGMVAFQYLNYVAAHHVPATYLGIVYGLVPLITLIIGVPILGISLSWETTIGVMVAFYGILFFLSGGHPLSIFRQQFGQGELLMLIASLSYALYGIMVNYWKVPLPIWVFVYVQTVLASVILLPFYLMASAPASPLNANNISLVVYASIGASIFAPVMWILALQKLDTLASALMNLVPVCTVITATLFLPDKLHWYHCIGGLLIITGVLLSQLWRKPEKQLDIAPVSTQNGQ